MTLVGGVGAESWRGFRSDSCGLWAYRQPSSCPTVVEPGDWASIGRTRHIGHRYPRPKSCFQDTRRRTGRCCAGHVTPNKLCCSGRKQENSRGSSSRYAGKWCSNFALFWNGWIWLSVTRVCAFGGSSMYNWQLSGQISLWLCWKGKGQSGHAICGVCDGLPVEASPVAPSTSVKNWSDRA